MTTPHINAVPLIEYWRGDLLESQHLGHAVIADARGIVAAWGDPAARVYPRSSVKMIQALPLLTSGAGRALSQRRLALACASHQGAVIHVDEVRRWLAELDLNEEALRCGAQRSRDREERARAPKPCQIHNNCSGKHTGFLMLSKHLKGDPDYIARDHPVQNAIFDAFEEVAGETITTYGIDGCSAPNPALTMGGVARAMAWFATAHTRDDAQSRAAAQLVEAMVACPEYVAGEGRACTALMRAMDGVAVKTGAEGYFIAIIPAKGLGVALKIADGATRAAEAAIAHILTGLGVLDAQEQSYINTEITNWRGIKTGTIRPSEGFAL